MARISTLVIVAILCFSSGLLISGPGLSGNAVQEPQEEVPQDLSALKGDWYWLLFSGLCLVGAAAWAGYAGKHRTQMQRRRELRGWIERARTLGWDEDKIRTTLAESGWPADLVDEEL